MRILIQASLLSALVHGIFFGGPILIGLVQASFYKPDFIKDFESVYYLQKEVAFGMIITPLGYVSLVISFLGVTLMMGLFLTLYKRWKKN